MSHRDQLTEKEKKEWDNACTLFEELFDDFNSKNLLRKGVIRIDRQRLAFVWENSRNYGLAFNEMVEKFRSEEKAEDFAQKCADAGLTKHTLTYLFVSQMIGTYLINLESVLRTSLLFFLEEECGITKNMTLGQLLRKIKEISPSIGAKLEKLVDTDLRNCLAHGTFWFREGGKVFLATNSYLEEVKEISFPQLIIESKKMSIVAVAFVHILDQKIKQGYFRI